MEDEFPSSVRKFLKSRSSILRVLHLMLPTLKKEPMFHYHVFYQYVLDHLQWAQVMKGFVRVLTFSSVAVETKCFPYSSFPKSEPKNSIKWITCMLNASRFTKPSVIYPKHSWTNLFNRILRSLILLCITRLHQILNSNHSIKKLKVNEKVFLK